MTRRYLTFIVIALMTIGLIFTLVSRARSPYEAPAELAPPSEGPIDGGDAGDPTSEAGPVDAASVPVVSSLPAPRPLRVTALGWELVAPATKLVDRGGKATVAVEVTPEVNGDGVFARLARGGDDKAGADVAIVPLADLVVSHDRVRALEPRAFAVVGFSHGGEEFRAAPQALAKLPGQTEDVALVGFGPGMSADAAATTSSSTSATMLGLFALDLLGVPPSRVRLVSPGAPEAKAANFAALGRGAGDPRRLAFSTADASRFAPLVMVASKALIDKDAARLRDFAHAWLDAAARSQADGSDVARKVSAKEGITLGAGAPNPPEALALLERLGQVEALPLAEQGRFVGPSARSSLTLATLMQRMWLLARGAGFTGSGAPDALPIDGRVLEGDPSPAPKLDDDPDGGVGTSVSPRATSLIVYRVVDPTANPADVAREIGFLGAIFERAVLRIAAKGGEKAARGIAATAQSTYGVSAARLSVTKLEPVGLFTATDVLALP